MSWADDINSCPYRQTCEGRQCLQLFMQHADIPTECLHRTVTKISRWLMGRVPYRVTYDEMEEAVYTAIGSLWMRFYGREAISLSDTLFSLRHEVLKILRKEYRIRSRQQPLKEAGTLIHNDDLYRLPFFEREDALAWVLRALGRYFDERHPDHADDLRQAIAQMMEDVCGLRVDFVVWGHLYNVPPEVLREVWQQTRPYFLTVLSSDASKSTSTAQERVAAGLRQIFVRRWPQYAPLLSRVLEAYLTFIERESRTSRRRRGRAGFKTYARKAGVPERVIEEILIFAHDLSDDLKG